MPLRVIICGGGIGGLSAAGYLRANHHVTVLERDTLDFTADDYGLSVVSNAFTLLQKAGLKTENLDMVIMTHLWVRNHKGEEARTMYFDTRERFGATSILVKRAKLQKELMRFATSVDFPGHPAEVVEKAKVTRVDALAGRVWTEDGRMFKGDLVIGADGISSLVRSAVLDGKDVPSAPRSHDLLAFRTRLSIDDIASNPDFAYLANPTSQAGLSSAFSVHGPQHNKRIIVYHTSPRHLQVLGYTSEKELAERFGDRSAIIRGIPASRVVDDFAPDFADNLVELFRHGSIDAWRIRDIVPMDTWFRGRTILIGDAAHAVTNFAGQGCNITIEDSEALGYLLRDATSYEDLQVAFGQFMALRKDRVDLVSRRSRELGNLQSEEDKTKQPIIAEDFAKAIYGYQGAEQSLELAQEPQ